MSAQSLLDQFKAARRISAPLLAVNTPDPGATITLLCQTVAAEKPPVATIDGEPAPTEFPQVEWDFIRGLTGRNEAGRNWVASLGEFDSTQNNPVGALVVARKLPARSVLFIHLAHRWAPEAAIVQALWNLRDVFKLDRRTLVLLSKHFEVPAELSDDVLTLEEPLPGEDELSEIVRRIHAAAELTVTDTAAPVEALRGLSAFAAEQVTAMSLKRSGLDVDALWERKRQLIEQTPGLKVFREGDRFEDIGGCAIVKSFLKRVMTGHAKPAAVVFVDEIEKMLGGSKGDLSGVTQDQLGAILSYMQDHASAGMIFIGPPGAAKSAVAKAAGNEGGVPTIQLDLGAAKGSLVGQSEQQLRNALKVITAVSNGRALWIATCNSIADLPPELRRRFTLGTFFFDLPSDTERAAIWKIYLEKYAFTDHKGFLGQELPNHTGWTGAEIRQCCDIAWRLGCKLLEAAAFIVPVSRSAADAISRMREQASGRFLSASEPGVYQFQKPNDRPPVSALGHRSLSLED